MSLYLNVSAARPRTPCSSTPMRQPTTTLAATCWPKPRRSDDVSFDDFDNTPAFTISVVAQLTGLHAQTLRQYDRVGLVTPQRTSGGGRRYSSHDIERLREIQRLS